MSNYPPQPGDQNETRIPVIYDPTGHQFVAPQAGTVTTDSSGNPSAPSASQALDGSGARVLANLDNVTILNVSAATTGTNSADQTNPNWRGLKVVINITVLTGTSPTLTFTVQGKDPVSGQYFTILASTALAAVAVTALTVYPGVTATANVAASDILPRTWRVLVTAGGTITNATYTVAALLEV